MLLETSRDLAPSGHLQPGAPGSPLSLPPRPPGQALSCPWHPLAPGRGRRVRPALLTGLMPRLGRRLLCGPQACCLPALFRVVSSSFCVLQFACYRAWSLVPGPWSLGVHSLALPWGLTGQVVQQPPPRQAEGVQEACGGSCGSQVLLGSGSQDTHRPKPLVGSSISSLSALTSLCQAEGVFAPVELGPSPCTSVFLPWVHLFPVRSIGCPAPSPGYSWLLAFWLAGPVCQLHPGECPAAGPPPQAHSPPLCSPDLA